MVSNPQGAFWQEDLVDGPNPHVAGKPIMHSKYPNSYANLMLAGSMAFIRDGARNEV
jgi:hypothetical protein